MYPAGKNILLAISPTSDTTMALGEALLPASETETRAKYRENVVKIFVVYFMSIAVREVAFGPLFNIYLLDMGGNMLVGSIESMRGLMQMLLAYPLGKLADSLPRVRVSKINLVMFTLGFGARAPHHASRPRAEKPLSGFAPPCRHHDGRHLHGRSKVHCRWHVLLGSGDATRSAHKAKPTLSLSECMLVLPGDAKLVLHLQRDCGRQHAARDADSNDGGHVEHPGDRECHRPRHPDVLSLRLAAGQLGPADAPQGGRRSEPPEQWGDV